jgi:hypothetical protein
MNTRLKHYVVLSMKAVLMLSPKHKLRGAPVVQAGKQKHWQAKKAAHPVKD